MKVAGDKVFAFKTYFHEVFWLGMVSVRKIVEFREKQNFTKNNPPPHPPPQKKKKKPGGGRGVNSELGTALPGLQTVHWTAHRAKNRKQ